MEESTSDDRGQDSGDPQQLDVAGHRVGHLVALKVIESKHGNPMTVLFRCDCGRKVRISINKIRKGEHRDACSRCWKAPPKRPGRPKLPFSGISHPSEYRTWLKIKRQARGRWQTSFIKFMKDMGPRPFKDAFLLRHNEKEKYCPSNCYWGKRGEKMLTRPMTYRGVTMTPSEAVRRFGMRLTFVDRCRKKGILTVEKMLELWERNQAERQRIQPVVGPEGFEL